MFLISQMLIVLRPLMSQVEEDRMFLRGLQMGKKANTNLSYVDSFLKYKNNQPEGIIIKQKVANLTTINILFSVHEGFKKVNKNFYKKLETDKRELLGREDLVEGIIDLIERIDVVYDDLYSWYPGMKYSDPWSFFIEIVPNIVYEYKKYYTRALLTRNKPKDKILNVFRSRINKSLGDFEVINKDMALFNLEQEQEEIKRIKKEGEAVRNIVSGVYWYDQDPLKVVNSDTLSLIGSPPTLIKYNEYILLELNCCLTMIEIEIGTKTHLISLGELDDLLNKNNRSKDKLMKLKIIDTNWNVLE